MKRPHLNPRMSKIDSVQQPRNCQGRLVQLLASPLRDVRATFSASEHDEGAASRPTIEAETIVRAVEVISFDGVTEEPHRGRELNFEIRQAGIGLGLVGINAVLTSITHEFFQLFACL